MSIWPRQSSAVSLRARIFRCLVIFWIALIPSPTSFAANTDTWTGAANDGLWATAGNWTSIPGPFVAAGAIDQTVIFGNTSPALNHTVTLPAGGVTLGTLTFAANNMTSGGYTLNLGNVNLSLDVTSGVAALNANNSAGNAAATISTTGTGVIRPNDNLTIDVESLGGVAIQAPLSGAISTITKTGPGSLTLNTNSEALTLTQGWALRGGLVSIRNESQLGVVGNDIRFEGGTLRATQTFTGSAGKSFDFQSGSFGTLEMVLTETLSSTDGLVGAGIMFKSGPGTLTVSAANTSFAGDVYVIQGALDASGNAFSLGTSSPGAGKIFVGNFARLSLPNTSVNGRLFRIASHGNLVAGNAALASLSRGGVNPAQGNLSLRAGAIVSENASGGLATNSFGNHADVYFGRSASLSSESITLGTGTAFAGLAAMRSGFSYNSGTITAQSDLTLLCGVTQSEYLRFGNSAFSAVSILSNGTPRTITIASSAGSGYASDDLGVGSADPTGYVRMSGYNPNFSGVSKFIVQPGTNLLATGTNSLDGKPVEVKIGGRLGDPDSMSFNYLAPNAFGNSTISLNGINQVVLYADLPYTQINYGGDFVVNGSKPVTFTTKVYFSSQKLSVSNLTFASNKSTVIFDHTSDGYIAPALFTGTIAGGTNDFCLRFADRPINETILAKLTGTGKMTYLAGPGASTEQIILRGDISGFTGDVVIKTGDLCIGDRRVAPSTEANIFGGLNGTSRVQIGAIDPLATGPLGFGVLRSDLNYDWNSRIDPRSNGILAIGNNSMLTGVNGSEVFIGSLAIYTLSSPKLAPGANNTYRLGTLNRLTLDSPGAGVLTGSSNVIIGAYRPDYLGDFTSSPNGSVTLRDSNDYSGTTTINRLCYFFVEANNGLTRAGNITVNGTMMVGGGTNGEGTITLASASEVSIGRLGKISITNGNLRDNSPSPDRFPNVALVKMKSATLEFVGRNVAGSTDAETIGSTELSEFNTVTLTPGNTTNSPWLILTALSRSLAAQVNVRATTGTLGGSGAGDPHLEIGGQGPGFVGGWTYVGGTDFASYSTSSGITALGGTRPSLASATPGSDPTTTTSTDRISSDISVRSYRIGAASAIDFGGKTLTLTSGGLLKTVASAVTINNGRITAGAANELIVYDSGSSGSLTINAAVVDNGSPVAVTIAAGSGGVALTGVNTYTGKTTVSTGALTLVSPLHGDVDLLAQSTLNLRSDTNQADFIPGTLRVNAGFTTSSPGTITVGRNASTTATGLEIGVKNLEIAADSILSISSSNSYGLAVSNSLVLHDHSQIDANTALIIRGAFSDTPYSIFGRLSPIVFDNGRSDNVINGNHNGNLTINGEQTSLTFQGHWNNVNDFCRITVSNGARLLFSEQAILDNSFGWYRVGYSAYRIEFAGQNGTVEFDKNFLSARRVDSDEGEDVNWGGILNLTGPITLKFNASQNWPSYQGVLSLAARDAVIQTATNGQTFGNIVALREGAAITFDAQKSLTLNGPVFIGTNAAWANLQAMQRDLSENNDLFMPTEDVATTAMAKLTKLGADQLNLNSRILVNRDSFLEAREGVLNLNGKVMATTGHNELHISNVGPGTYNFNASVEVGGAMELKIDFNGVASAVTFQAGKTLSGDGRLLNDVVFVAGGKLAPGNSPGMVEVNSLTLLAGSSYEAQLTGILAGDWYDQVRVNGTVNLAGDFVGLLDYVPTLGDKFWVIDNDGIDPITGTFAGLSQGGFFTLVSAADSLPYYFQIFYNTDFGSLNGTAGTGNDVMLVNVAALPEPTTWALTLAGGVALILTARRKRHRKHYPTISL